LPTYANLYQYFRQTASFGHPIAQERAGTLTVTLPSARTARTIILSFHPFDPDRHVGLAGQLDAAPAFVPEEV